MDMSTLQDMSTHLQVISLGILFFCRMLNVLGEEYLAIGGGGGGVVDVAGGKGNRKEKYSTVWNLQGNTLLAILSAYLHFMSPFTICWLQIGEMAFEFLNLNGIPACVFDPRPLELNRFARKLSFGYYHR